MDDLLREFLTETSENLSVLDLELVKLEQNPNDTALLSSIFRLMHTVKGTCGFLGLPRLEKVAHASENVLGKFRDGALEVTPAAVSLILRSLDTIKSILSVLEQTQAEPAGDDAELIDLLNAWAEGKLESAAAPVEAVAAAPAPVDAAPEPVADIAAVEAPKAAVEIEKPKAQAVVAVEDNTVKESAVAAQSIRVSVNLLESLMTTVSELVLTRNQLLQIARRHKDSEFTVPLQRLSQITSELQEGVMKTRMQPIGNAWSKLPRLIRDLSHDLGKKIDLVMLGADTELDRQVLELIKDPLTHMVRNSADHGIEMPKDRASAGKPETGKVTLNAYHEGGHILIEVSDDGKGLDIQRIRSKAVANGIATEAELDQMSEQQIYQFIFKAGFSTAQKVTAVSGRGVGMDVVRTNIEKIGGTIEFFSKPGGGSTFVIKIPLTLAIVSALIVESCGERFAIPQISVIELVRASANSEHAIERIHGTPVLRLRNRLLPLVSLERLLKLDRAETAQSKGNGAEETFIVVAQVGTYSFGILVDRVFDTEEIVVKPVAPILRNVTLFSGNTILGDGGVIMILDPNGIAAASGEAAGTDTAAAEAQNQLALAAGEKTALLVFRAGGESPKAVPLSLVARLEEIDLEKVEYTAGRPLVQYRGKLMPLVPIGGDRELAKTGRQPILVFADDDRSMGLIVEEIVDIVEDRINVQLKAEQPGLMGSAIIGGKATDVIDAGHYLSQAFGDWFGSGRTQVAAEKPKKVLVVDDSPFFRNMLTPLLSVAGYEVTSAESADQALQMQEAGVEIDVIVSDIEMPGTDGFAFAEAVRSHGRWREKPMVALTSRTSPGDLDRGRVVGFSDYVAKFDRDSLLKSLSQTLARAS
ncbi:MAG: chemotaxis protein CheW [Rhodospirillaceae bacterium]|nr:chemotaxis protein CheW [Rhodospirillaceae bacterium]